MKFGYLYNNNLFDILGILNMIWHQYLIKKLSAITNLIEKV